MIKPTREQVFKIQEEQRRSIGNGNSRVSESSVKKKKEKFRFNIHRFRIENMSNAIEI